MQVLSTNNCAVVGVILAGGLGRRLGGGDKALRLLAGQPLVAHVVARLAPQLAPGRLLLNANGVGPELTSFGLPLLADTRPGRPGPLAGILAAMQAIRSEAGEDGWVLSAPTDTPFLPLDLVARLAEQQSSAAADIVLAGSAAGLCQVCGLWSCRLADALAQSLAIGQNKVLAFASAHKMSQVTFPPQPVGGEKVDPFFNINTADDLAAAERLLSHESQ